MPRSCMKYSSKWRRLLSSWKSLDFSALYQCDSLRGWVEQLPYELLAPVYDWFTEGFATVDLQAAKALIDALQ